MFYNNTFEHYWNESEVRQGVEKDYNACREFAKKNSSDSSFSFVIDTYENYDGKKEFKNHYELDAGHFLEMDVDDVVRYICLSDNIDTNDVEINCYIYNGKIERAIN